jgi:hypothetical protein
VTKHRCAGNLHDTFNRLCESRGAAGEAEVIYKTIQIILAFIIFFIVPAASIWAVINGLRTGVVNSHDILYSRVEHPIAYWTLIATWGGIAVAVPALFAVIVIRRMH